MVPQCPVWSYDIEIIQDDTDQVEFIWNDQDYVVLKKYCSLHIEIDPYNEGNPEYFESVRTTYDELNWGDRCEAIWNVKNKWAPAT